MIYFMSVPWKAEPGRRASGAKKDVVRTPRPRAERREGRERSEGGEEGARRQRDQGERGGEGEGESGG